jgi:hypothetical protein
MKNIYSGLMYLLLGSVAAAQTGAVSGVIVDQAGTAIVGATVRYSRLPLFLPPKSGSPARLAPGESYFSASITTDALGRHSLQNVPAGAYLVCVDAPDLPILDPCKWDTPPLLEVTGNRTTNLDFTVWRGVFLRVRVNDPIRLLPSSESSPLAPAHLIVGVFFGTGASLAAQRVGADAGGQDYRMAIPAGVPLDLWVVSGFVSLADQNGAALKSTGTRIPFEAVPGVDQTFTIAVTGKLSAATQ